MNYNPAEYPQGVPSPYTGNVHPYPSYEHGPDYTRPVFGRPFVRRPYNVTSGLGAETWRPRLNRTGRPTVQPQPNPYAAHWPEALGQADDENTGVAAGLTAGFFVGAALGLVQAALYADEYPKGTRSSTIVMRTALGGIFGAIYSAIPVYATAIAAKR